MTAYKNGRYSEFITLSFCISFGSKTGLLPVIIDIFDNQDDETTRLLKSIEFPYGYKEIKNLEKLKLLKFNQNENKEWEFISEEYYILIIFDENEKVSNIYIEDKKLIKENTATP